MPRCFHLDAPKLIQNLATFQPFYSEAGSAVTCGGQAVSDLYRVLGLKRGATQDDIRRAYRRKAKISHPDSGGSAGAFGELATAHAVLSDPERRERYDSTGEIDPPRVDTLEASAIEVIAQKLGLIIHAEQDVTSLDIGALIEGAILEDMAQRRSNMACQMRAIERTTRLRARIKRKSNGQDNMLAKVLDWHESSTWDQIKKNEAAVSSLERALAILKDYSFAHDLAPATGDDVCGALHDALQALEELAAVLKTGPTWCDVDVARPSAGG
jgi:curved DNA-binding protein CbpA